jgi:hypothetical protein
MHRYSLLFWTCTVFLHGSMSQSASQWNMLIHSIPLVMVCLNPVSLIEVKLPQLNVFILNLHHIVSFERDYNTVHTSLTYFSFSSVSVPFSFFPPYHTHCFDLYKSDIFSLLSPGFGKLRMGYIWCIYPSWFREDTIAWEKPISYTRWSLDPWARRSIHNSHRWRFCAITCI